MITKVTVGRTVSKNYQGFSIALEETLDEGVQWEDAEERLHRLCQTECKIWLAGPEAQKP